MSNTKTASQRPEKRGAASRQPYDGIPLYEQHKDGIPTALGEEMQPADNRKTACRHCARANYSATIRMFATTAA